MPITTCDSLETLRAEIDSVRKQLALDETEETWDTIAQGILRLTRLCNNGGCDFPSDMLAGIRSVSKPLNGALNSERSRLSGATIELLTALATGLGSSFEPLVSCLIPTLLALCGRTNKVFTSRARTCILSIIEQTRLPSLLPYLAGLANHKSVLPRLTAAEGILACLNCFNPPDLEKESRARIVEDFIKLTARDANADVRKASKEVFKAYKILMPERVESFVAPLTPVVRKYLDIQVGPSGNHGSMSNAAQKQASRPSSRANNKMTAGEQRPAISTLPKPPARSITNDAPRSSQQRPVIHSPATAADIHTTRQRTTSQVQRGPPPSRNLGILPAQSSSAAQRCAIPTSAPIRQIVDPSPGITSAMVVRSTYSTVGPQRPPPMQIKFNAPSDRMKVAGNGAKRVPLPTAPVNGQTCEQGSATTNSVDQASGAVERPCLKPSGRNVETTTIRKLVVGRKAPESTRPTSSIKPGNGSVPPGPTAVQRSHKPLAKDQMTKPSRVAPQRRPAGNIQKGTRSLVKADRKETLPALIPLPPSPSIPPTEIPLPPSRDSTPTPADPEAKDRPLVASQSGSTDPASKQLKSAESTQEQGASGSPSTPITSLLSSIQRGFLFTPISPLSPPQNYLSAPGDGQGKMQGTIIVNEFTKASLVGAPFCVPLEEHSAADGINRHALRDLN